MSNHSSNHGGGEPPGPTNDEVSSDQEKDAHQSNQEEETANNPEESKEEGGGSQEEREEDKSPDEDPSIDKGFFHEILDEVRKEEINGLDPEKPITYGSWDEMLRETGGLILYYFLNDIVLLLQGRTRNSRDCECDADEVCIHHEVPFWLESLTEIIYIICVGGLLLFSYQMFHSVGLSKTIILFVDSLHLVLYITVVMRRLVGRIVGVIEAIIRGLQHLRGVIK